ncbi:MAG: thioesterase family protein [Microthrixaceae bacterium]|nr:thioesterase family protein [Microthrixaceae bacterium]
MTGPFARATAVVPGDRSGTYLAEVAEGWDIGGNANGGYLLAIAARALTDATGRDRPVSLTAHYLSPGRPGPLDVDTTIVREGRRFTTASATMSAEGRPVLAVLGTFGDDDVATGAPAGPDDVGGRWVAGGPPELPLPEDCIGGPDRVGEPPSFATRVVQRLHPDDLGFARGEPTGRAEMRGWFRLADDEPMDAIAATCAIDAFPPTIFNLELPVGWTPTLELTVHVRRQPAPGWLACVFTTRFVTDGVLEEDGELWDSAGQLVAQGRQLALVPRDTGRVPTGV